MADGGCQGACLERWTNGRIRRRWACIRFATALRKLLSRITRNFYTLPTLPMPNFLGRRRPRFVFSSSRRVLRLIVPSAVVALLVSTRSRRPSGRTARLLLLLLF
jgi:hypothetical protein